MKATPYLLDEAAAGVLGRADERSVGLFLVYSRDSDTFACSGLRLILARDLAALREYIDNKPPSVALHTRTVNVMAFRDLPAMEDYFACKVEVAPEPNLLRIKS